MVPSGNRSLAIFPASAGRAAPLAFVARVRSVYLCRRVIERLLILVKPCTGSAMSWGSLELRHVFGTISRRHPVTTGRNRMPATDPGCTKAQVEAW
jgi:hypothetical protein